jgi:hypothetical protein
MTAPADEARRWRSLYTLVIATLVFEIALLWAITRAYS